MPRPSSPIFVLAFAPIVLLTGCDVTPPPSTTIPPPSLAAQIEAAAASLGTATSATVAVPDTADVWLISAPYALDSKLPELNLDLSRSDKRLLSDANNMRESTMVARIADDRIGGYHYIESVTVYPSPSMLLVRAGDVLIIRRTNNEHTLDLTKETR